LPANKNKKGTLAGGSISAHHTSVEEERQNTRRIAASVMFYTGFSKRLSGNSRHRPRGGEYRMMPAAIYLF